MITGKKFAAFDAQGNVTAFYDSVDSPVPDEVSAVEIDFELWLDLIAAQSTGKRLVIDKTGKVAALDPLPPTRAEAAFAKRMERDAALHATDWLVSRHQDEQLLGDGTTLTADQFAALLRYRQSLREASDLPGWPYTDLPSPPPFATAQPKATA
ncbi:phage tail protein [Burkholderia sp. MS389]|uniref:phage tail assembly chaperone n=1 Tax=unclassified Burkholderia TaxID=2613784 RepID=UPI000B79DFD9|nr:MULTISPECIES: phage tail assembly chaperone [unclassified Burkholderia]OXI76696.1 phage tail protein [Burkholderia sp. AU31280]QRR13707.1 phage tail protein [Burkholderia sp. MS389]